LKVAGRRPTKIKPFSGFGGIKRRVRAALAFAKPWERLLLSLGIARVRHLW
jgi:hypothetical protein